jgi:PiT family inorganic phosphate transporter
MTPLLIVLTGVLVAFFNGANDNSKGVATLYGSRALSYARAIGWATLTTLAGSFSAAVFSRTLVKRFSGKGLVPDPVASDPGFLLAVGLGAALALFVATWLGSPVSTTHALLGGLVGSGAVFIGADRLGYSVLGSAFVLPLLLSPVLALLLAAMLQQALGVAMKGLGITEETCVCVVGQEQVTPGGGAVVLATGLAVAVDDLERCERHFSGRVLGLDVRTTMDRFHILSAGAVSFARGLNDTPKIAALLLGIRALGVTADVSVVGVAIAAGGLIAAHRVAKTMSFGITPLDHGQGLAANLVTAAVVIAASPFGLPVSTTHVSCGSLFGIGIVSGRANARTVRQILGAWLVTLPLAAGAAAVVATIVRMLR